MRPWKMENVSSDMSTDESEREGEGGKSEMSGSKEEDGPPESEAVVCRCDDGEQQEREITSPAANNGGIECKHTTYRPCDSSHAAAAGACDGCKRVIK